MKEYLGKNKGVIVTILSAIGILIGFQFPAGTAMGTEQEALKALLAEAVTPIVREVVQEELAGFEEAVNLRFDELIMQTYAGDIDVLALALGQVRSGGEVDEIVTFWIAEGWTGKIKAIQRVSEYEPARECLRDKLFSDEVFQALMTYAN